MKRRLVFLSCVVAAALSMTPAAYAHNGDVFPGSYLLNKQKNLKFRISMSAQTSLMNKDVYESALKWNNISSNVHVTIIMETPGMPSIADTMGVYDGRGGNYNGVDYFTHSSAYAVTHLFDSNGNRIDPTKKDSYNKIAYVKILMNINKSYSQLSNPTEGAAMTFTHEVGHALMLSHPRQDPNLADHKMSAGRPYAVMNEGLPYSRYSYVSPIPTYHDKDCLKGKWGV